MVDDYGDTAVKCGSLLGFDVPAPGGIKDVAVTWTQAQNDLKKQGKLDCATVACITKTGDDGIARLVFTPNIEPLPGVGIEREDTGVIDGVALYQSAAGGGVVGGIAQFLTPKFGSARWFVRSHQPRRLKFAMPHEYPERPPTEGANIGYSVDAHMCGSAPYRTAWSGTRHTLMTGYGGQFPDKHVTLDDLFLTPGQPASPSHYPLYSSTVALRSVDSTPRSFRAHPCRCGSGRPVSTTPRVRSGRTRCRWKRTSAARCFRDGLTSRQSCQAPSFWTSSPLT